MGNFFGFLVRGLRANMALNREERELANAHRKDVLRLEKENEELRERIEEVAERRLGVDSRRVDAMELLTLIDRELEDPTGEGCTLHGHAPHGKEAEELRSGIEAILLKTIPTEGDPRDAWHGELNALLDRVSARDSNAHLRANDALEDARKHIERLADRHADEMAELRNKLGGSLVEFREKVHETMLSLITDLTQASWQTPNGDVVACACAERVEEKLSAVLEADIKPKLGRSYALDCTRIAATAAIRTGIRGVMMDPSELLMLVDTKRALDDLVRLTLAEPKGMPGPATIRNAIVLIRSGLNSLAFAAPENAHLFYERFSEAADRLEGLTPTPENADQESLFV